MIVEFKNVSKSFFGVKAVDDVSFGLEAGHLLGLIGENGAGKSTLMNLLGGVLQPDEGEIFVAGEPFTPRSPRDAKRGGVAFIHQELNLFTNLSIAENLFIDDYPKLGRLPLLNSPALHRRAREALTTVALELSPTTRVETLTPGERQLVEIAKAVSADAKVIIFDEPTTSLTNRETEHLFALLEQLRAGGTTLIYISHILSDVLELSDDIMVMRDSKFVEKDVRSAFDTRRMISLMVGRDIEQLYPERPTTPPGEALLKVEGLSQTGIVENVSFEVRAGEVLGLFGLMGSGRSELARILFGLDPFEQGSLSLAGERLENLTPRLAIDKGLAFVNSEARRALC